MKTRIQDSTELPDCVKSILLPAGDKDEILKRLLTDPPFQAIELSNTLMEQIKQCILSPISDKDQFVKTLSACSAFKSVNMAEPLAIQRRHLVPSLVEGPYYPEQKIRAMLKKVFDYDTQLGQNKHRAYKITFEQGRNTCTYCNRMYCFTVIHNSKNPTQFQSSTNDDNRIVRPQLDHWFDKSDYPLLSLNLYNLIPSCPICNSSIKGAVKFSLSTHIHPYLYKKDSPDFKFKFTIDSSGTPSIPLTVRIDTSKCSQSEKNMIRDLALEDIYAYHGEHEGRDIFLWKLQHTPDYLHNLMKNIPASFTRTPEEVYRMFFGTEYLPENNLNRPLSKLKRDLLEDLDLKII